MHLIQNDCHADDDEAGTATLWKHFSQMVRINSPEFRALSHECYLAVLITLQKYELF